MSMEEATRMEAQAAITAIDHARRALWSIAYNMGPEYHDDIRNIQTSLISAINDIRRLQHIPLEEKK